MFQTTTQFIVWANWQSWAADFARCAPPIWPPKKLGFLNGGCLNLWSFKELSSQRDDQLWETHEISDEFRWIWLNLNEFRWIQGFFAWFSKPMVIPMRLALCGEIHVERLLRFWNGIPVGLVEIHQNLHEYYRKCFYKNGWIMQFKFIFTLNPPDRWQVAGAAPKIPWLTHVNPLLNPSFRNYSVSWEDFIGLRCRTSPNCLGQPHLRGCVVLAMMVQGKIGRQTFVADIKVKALACCSCPQNSYSSS